MAADDDVEDAEPLQIPWKKIGIAVVVVVVALAGYFEVTSSVTSGEPFPANVTVSGTANLPNVATTAAIAHYVYFNFPNGKYDTANVTISNNKYTYSIVLQNRVNYTVQIGYSELVGLTATCDAGTFNLASHSNSSSFDATCTNIQ